jgi:ERCC4-type nuclease
MNLEIQTRSLDVGDIAMYVQDQLVWIWERKTLPDLASSIRDGRFSSQKARTLAFKTVNPHVKVGFIIEGNWTKVRDDAVSRVRGALCNLAMHSEWHVLPTKDVTGTAQSLINMSQKLHVTDATSSRPEPLSSASTTISDGHYTPRKMTDSRDIFVQQLMCLPSIGGESAKHIAQEFGSMSCFLQGLQGEQRFATISRLEGIKCKSRTLGAKKTKVVVDHFMPDTGPL